MAGAGIPKWLQYVNKFPLGMIINGEFWVCVFAILSGYLLNKKDIRNGADLIKICINRYFRFVIPFFFANFFVYLLYNFVGFSAQKCGMIVNNQWLLNQYTNAIDFISVVKNSLMLGNELNNNFWIIKHMLFNEYWFMRVYFYLILCVPFLNKLINSLQKKEYKQLILLGIVLMVIPASIPGIALFNSDSGNGILWFIMLYLTGAYLQKYPPKFSAKFYMLMAFGFFMI